MNDLYQCLVVIDKVEVLGNVIFAFSMGKKYFYKKIDYSKEELLQYFSEIDFCYLPTYIHSSNSFLLCEAACLSFENKLVGEKLVFVLSTLHQKSLIIHSYQEDEKKRIYDSIFSTIDERMKYYLSLQDNIDEFEFPSPSYYLLVKNISKFYQLLHFSFSKLDEWYQNSGDEYREAFLIDNVCFDNFCVTESSSYFFDYGVGKRGFLVYDFVSFFRKEYSRCSMNNLLSLYQEYFPLEKSEISLLYCLISIPDEISFTNHSYVDTISVRKVVDYVDMVNRFLLEEDKKNQEADQEKFKEENDDINFGSNENEN